MATVPRATAQQLVASDPGASSWVTASAGTGKTHVLTDRLLRLLLAGSAPERILCLTFTKAAAAEMYNRLHRRLGGWAIADDATLAAEIEALSGQPAAGVDLAAACRLFARVLEAPGGLKIQTIHAFCEALLRRFPVEAGLAPHFQVMDERDAGELRALAQDKVLAAAAADDDSAIAVVTPLVNQDQFDALMRRLLADRSRLQRFLAVYGNDAERAAAAIPGLLGLRAGETEASVLTAACDETAFDAPALRRVADSMREGSKGDREHAGVILAWLDEPATRPRQFDAYLATFVTDSGQGTPRQRGFPTKAVLAEQPDGAEVLAREAERLVAVRDHLRRIQTAAATAALIRLGAALLSAYEKEKHAQARLDYDDLILFARDLLTRADAASWVLYKLDGGLDHILLDEAQDTNPEQWEVIRALADEFFAGEGARGDGRTIFAVGDVKQSIYGFQRADPASFTAMRDYFADRVTAAGLTWRPTELHRSYRSTEAVLQAVDVIFATPAARAGVSPDDGEIRHSAFRAGQAGLVEIWPSEQPLRAPADDTGWQPPLEQEPEDLPVQRLARRIANQLQCWFADGERLDALGRPMQPGDVLILVQKRAPFVEVMVRELKRRGIPVAGVDRMVLTEQLAVMDLIALGQFLLLPDDDLTLATVLKSPLLGLSDAQLFTLAWQRSGSLWQSLQRHADDDPRFADARRLLTGLLAVVDIRRPYELFAALLGPDGGRARILSRLGPDADDPIDEFLDLALAYEHEHAPSLQGFLHWLGAATTEIKRDLEAGGEQVRVMTVHGAKGLQAPVVFLADTCRLPSRDRTFFWHGDSDADLPLWRPRAEMEEPLSAAARAADSTAVAAENRRLFYVALTRAADRLYICGFEGKNKRPSGCWYDLAWDALAADPDSREITLPWDGTGLRLVSRQHEPVAVPAAAAAAAAPAALPAWLRQPAPPEPAPPSPLAPSRPTETAPPVASPSGDDGRARFRRGQVIHQLLQHLPALPVGARAAAAERFLDRPAHGLAPDDRAEIAAQVLAILDDPAFAALFGPDSRAEIAVSGVVGEHAVSGQIDRLVVGDSAVLVVDYKSNRPPPTRVEQVPAAYLRQLAAYRTLLREIYPGKTIDCALLWTAVPALMAIPPALLEGHEP